MTVMSVRASSTCGIPDQGEKRKEQGTLQLSSSILKASAWHHCSTALFLLHRCASTRTLRLIVPILFEGLLLCVCLIDPPHGPVSLARGNSSRFELHGIAIAIDCWRCDADIYILTHLHADHCEGLTNSWRRGQVLCSAATHALVLRKWPALRPLVAVVPLQEPFIVHVVGHATPITTIFLDAQHCLVRCSTFLALLRQLLAARHRC